MQPNIKQVTIRSKDLKNGSFQLPKAMFVTGVKVESMYVPYTFTNVGRLSDKLYLRQRTTVGSTIITVPATITLTHGNYTASQFVTVLTQRLNSGISGFNGIWGVSLSETTAKITISNDAREFIVESGENSINNLIGFQNPSVTYSNNHTGSGIVNLSPTRLLNLKSNSLGNMLEDVIYSGNINDNSVLASVYLTNPFGSYSEFRPHSSGYMSLGTGQTIRVDAFDISIVDESMLPIDFQNIDWFVTLTFI